MQQFPIKTAKQRALALIIFTLFHNVQHTFFFSLYNNLTKKEKKKEEKKKKTQLTLTPSKAKKTHLSQFLCFFL